MDTYQALKRICTIWIIVSFVAAILISLYGLSQLQVRNGGGFAYFGLAALVVFATYTFTELVYLLTDIALSLRRISKQGDTPTTIRKLPKD